MPTRPTTRVSVSRRIGADPTSTALLLAGPSAVDLWPGVERVARVDGSIVVEARVDRAGPSLQIAVAVRPPARTPTSFVTTFTWAGADLPATSGTLTLTYVPDAGGVPHTQARLVLQAEDLDDSALDLEGLTAMAERFLANLAGAAEARRAA
jgi:hypothetical protein